MKMRSALAAFAVAAGLAGAQAAFGQSVTFNYEDGTDQGWGTAFGADSGVASGGFSSHGAQLFAIEEGLSAAWNRGTTVAPHSMADTYKTKTESQVQVSATVGPQSRALRVPEQPGDPIFLPTNFSLQIPGALHDPRFQGCVRFLDLPCHVIEAVGQDLDLIACADRDAMVELAGAEPLRSQLQLADRRAETIPASAGGRP